jgi:hypothetical protein
MAKRDEDFGTFGSIDPLERRDGWFWLVMKLILLGIIAGVIAAAYSGWSELYQRFLENGAPIIKVVSPPPGFGLEPGELKIKISDDAAGIDEVIVRLEQGGMREDLLRKTYDVKQLKDMVVVPIDAKGKALNEGSFRIHIIVFDKSFWSNSSKTVLEFPVDYIKPRIQVITQQHNAVSGGVELVFYRVLGEEGVFSGVRVGSRLFPGFPARTLDPDFESLRDVYFAFFAVPLSFDDKTESLRVFARDPVGNMNSSSMYYRVKKYGRQALDREIDRELYDREIEPLYETYQKELSVQKKLELPEYLPAVDEVERHERVRTVLRDYSAFVEEQLSQLFSHPKSLRMWKGRFGRQPGRKLPFDFGAPVRFAYNGEEVAVLSMDQAFFRTNSGTPVWSANEGVVIFAGALGPFGKSVIVDHGFGLSTLYSHMSSIEHLEGTRVSSGDLLGRSGASGFLPYGEGVGFTVRLHGLAVRPEEWWDERWIADHIEKKIHDVKRELGVLSFRPLER